MNLTKPQLHPRGTDLLHNALLNKGAGFTETERDCLLYTSPSPRD